MERNVYEKPEERVLLRTADAYQTEARDDVESYSDKLLAIVAEFRNGGQPEGMNAQSMVGKSKRGEVACRLFSRIDPATGIIEAAGFKARGCLAMTGCASAVCTMIEGEGIERALQLSIEDVREAVDDVPPGKVNALHFAVCAVRALVGDFLLREGADLTQLDEAVPCDELSVSCIMAEHCSLRQSRLEARMAEEEAERARAADNAAAAVFDLVRADAAAGRLTAQADWTALAPAQMTAGEFEEWVLGLLDEAEPAPAEGAEARSSASVPKRSEYANRGVGIPRIFSQEADAPAEMPETKRAIPKPEPAADGDDFELRPPEGYELVETEDGWALAPTGEAAAPAHRVPAGEGIRRLESPHGTYLYDGNAMTVAFARWAYLAQEDDPLAAFASCVREESRTYPRPMARESFANRPLNMDAETVDALCDEAAAQCDYADIHRIEASNGDVYYFSDKHLEPAHAQSLAEWSSVGRYMNV